MTKKKKQAKPNHKKKIEVHIKLKNKSNELQDTKIKQKFPEEFPFWARLKISKNRTTLVIDEEMIRNKKTQKVEEGFVHREATSTFHKGFEEIDPNPDKSKSGPMYLKGPRKIPKKLVKPHNRKLDMPQHLKERYSKNNKKQ